MTRTRHLTIPVNIDQNVHLSAMFPLAPHEWDRLFGVLEAMKPALIDYHPETPLPVDYEVADKLARDHEGHCGGPVNMAISSKDVETVADVLENSATIVQAAIAKALTPTPSKMETVEPPSTEPVSKPIAPDTNVGSKPSELDDKPSELPSEQVTPQPTKAPGSKSPWCSSYQTDRKPASKKKGPKVDRPRLTAEQFDAVVNREGMDPTAPVVVAAGAVLVHGMSASKAANSYGVKWSQGVNKLIRETDWSNRPAAVKVPKAEPETVVLCDCGGQTYVASGKRTCVVCGNKVKA